ncbi:MAG: hypothetical protein V4482_03725 [Pseudomonadota bacterium]
MFTKFLIVTMTVFFGTNVFATDPYADSKTFHRHSSADSLCTLEETSSEHKKLKHERAYEGTGTVLELFIIVDYRAEEKRLTAAEERLRERARQLNELKCCHRITWGPGAFENSNTNLENSNSKIGSVATFENDDREQGYQSDSGSETSGSSLERKNSAYHQLASLPELLRGVSFSDSDSEAKNIDEEDEHETRRAICSPSCLGYGFFHTLSPHSPQRKRLSSYDNHTDPIWVN